MENTNRVLLTNAQLRKCLAAARSLGRKGVYVIAAEYTRFNPVVFSKYCRKFLVSPDARDSEKYCEWLIDTIRENKCTVLFPMDDDTMDVAIKYRGRLEQFCHLPIPPTQSYFAVCDKAGATRHAMESGVSCPKTVMPESIDEIERLCKITADMSFPVIIKPRRSSGSRGTRVVETREDLPRVYAEVHRNYPFPIIQEYMKKGDIYNVCLLYNRNSELRATFVQKEVRNFPIDIGPSTVQESVICPEVVELALKFMEKLPWYGVAELEFMVDGRDGKLKFMEINARFWNSLYTSILAGVDFPWMLYRIAVEGDVESVTQYRPGVFGRWLFGDLLHFMLNPERLKMEPRCFFSKFPKLHDDILSRDDPLPSVGLLLACIRYLPNLDMWRFMFKR